VKPDQKIEAKEVPFDMYANRDVL